MRTFLFTTALCLCLFSMVSCEKMETESDSETTCIDPGTDAPVTFRIASKAHYASGETDKPAFTRITLAAFQDGAIVDQLTQSVADKDFGTCAMKLDSGTYTIVALAHNCCKAVAMNSNPSKVEMPDDKDARSNQKVTDTFWCNEVVTVGSGDDVNLDLRRIVAKFVLSVQDTIPANAATMKFYYTGGSSTLDALNGTGARNSRQTVNIPVSREMKGRPADFEVFTFPRANSQSLKMTITALDAAGNIIKEVKLDDVPIAVNKTTRWRTAFFGGSADPDNPDNPDNDGVTFEITVDDSWDSQMDYAY